jgi:hypothetical protein
MDMPVKKILLGVCDIGNGHISRQKCIIRELLKCNVELILAVTENSIMKFDYEFPEIKKVLINIPWVSCDNEGVNFEDTLRRYRDSKKDQFESFLEFSVKVRQCFHGDPPDIVMTDYEPNVAQFAYAMNIPLICMEQHSKFLYLHSEEIDGVTINEGAARLRFFFPKVDYRFISSFSPISIEDKEGVTVLSPIIRKLTKSKIDQSKIVVYFSPYTDDTKQFEKVLEMLTERRNYRFVIYSELKFNNYEKYPQFTFKRIGEKFIDDISDCCCIISSAGHQLISESISINTPVLVYCFSTYDQKHCAKMVEEYKLGKVIKRFDKKEFDDFLNDLELYRRNMFAFRQEYWTASWDDTMLNVLNDKYGIHKM